MDEDNTDEDDMVDAYNNINSKDVMLVYASGDDTDVGGEDQDTATICYEDQAQRESGEDQDTVIYFEDQAQQEDCPDYNNGGIKC